MSRRANVPSRDAVVSAVESLLAEGGSRPTVTALAQSLGVAPSTFWRHFPDQAQRVVAQGRRRPQPTHPDRLARLTTENRELRAQLNLAAASIMRLTCENEQLTAELHLAKQVSVISSRRRK